MNPFAVVLEYDGSSGLDLLEFNGMTPEARLEHCLNASETSYQSRND